MVKYTTVLFDADDTLLDFKAAEREAIEKTFLSYGFAFSEEMGMLYSQINDKMWKKFEKGEITREQIKTERFKILLEQLGLKADTAQMAKKYMDFLSLSAPLIEGAKEMLKELKERYSLYIVTNGTAWVQKSRLSLSGLLPYLNGVFISEELGSKKPDKLFFSRVFEKIPEKDTKKIIIVGDSMSSDILGGINAGIDTLYFYRDKEDKTYTPTYKAGSFKEILRILKDA